MVYLQIPNKPQLRELILGENNRFLRDISMHTGAEVRLAPARLGYRDNERSIQIRGQETCINRAIQMLKTAVITHCPRWRFPEAIENMLRSFKALEVCTLAESTEIPSERWNIGHLVFVPTECIPEVEKAKNAGAFVASCAVLEVDTVVVGKVNIDAPTVDQADAALIQLCDVVRTVVPGWVPDVGHAKAVIESADAESGPALNAQLLKRSADSQLNTYSPTTVRLSPAAIGWKVKGPSTMAAPVR